MSAETAYAGKILKVDLSSGNVTRANTSDYAPRFLGGRGIAAKIYWDEVSPDTGALDPENRLIFSTGPLAGFTGLASSRWQVCAKSPATDTEQFCYANLGGNWGVNLKFAGYDGLVIHGKADKPVYLAIQDGTVEIRDAASLWGKGAVTVRKALKAELGNSVRVLTTGPAGDHLVSFASLLADNDAAASCGFGAVMGSKNLKAIVVRGRSSFKAAQPEQLRELSHHIRELQADRVAERPALVKEGKMLREACWGCPTGCNRIVYKAADGTKGKFMCQASVFYTERARRYYGESTEVPFRATQLCNDYGLDTNVIETMIMWLSRCQRAGILNDDNTGIPMSKMGSLEFIETLVRKISLREGFGDVLAQGLAKAAQTVGKAAQELITDFTIKASQSAHYEARLYIITGLFYAMEPRQPIQQLHEVSRLVNTWMRQATKQEEGHLSTPVLRAITSRFWGSEAAADFSNYDGKALAAKNIQDRQYVKECLILCDFSWPVMYVSNSEDHVGDPTLESQVFAAVTGQAMDEAEMNRFGERVFNLQRAILAREGHRGRESDQLPEQFFTIPLRAAFSNPEGQVPGKDGEIFSRQGMVVDREQFEQMKTEYYQLRGWNPATGLQTRGSLKKLGMADIADGLAKDGLLG